MKTNDLNSLETKSTTSRIAEINEAILKIKDQLFEIRISDESRSNRYMINNVIRDAEIYLECVEIKLEELGEL
jgi:hypothetical protein